MLADARGPLGEDFAPLIADTHVFEGLRHKGDIAEFALTVFHQHAQRRAELD